MELNDIHEENIKFIDSTLLVLIFDKFIEVKEQQSENKLVKLGNNFLNSILILYFLCSGKSFSKQKFIFLSFINI